TAAGVALEAGLPGDVEPDRLRGHPRGRGEGQHPRPPGSIHKQPVENDDVVSVVGAGVVALPRTGNADQEKKFANLAGAQDVHQPAATIVPSGRGLVGVPAIIALFVVVLIRLDNHRWSSQLAAPRNTAFSS